MHSVYYISRYFSKYLVNNKIKIIFIQFSDLHSTSTLMTIKKWKGPRFIIVSSFKLRAGYNGAPTVFNECYEIVCLSNKLPTWLCLLPFYWLLLRNKLGVIVTIQVSRLYRSDSIYVDYVVVLVVVAREKKVLCPSCTTL